MKKLFILAVFLCSKIVYAGDCDLFFYDESAVLPPKGQINLSLFLKGEY